MIIQLYKVKMKKVYLIFLVGTYTKFASEIIANNNSILS